MRIKDHLSRSCFRVSSEFKVKYEVLIEEKSYVLVSDGVISEVIDALE